MPSHHDYDRLFSDFRPGQPAFSGEKAKSDQAVLQEKRSEAKRLKRLRSATGVPYPTGYRLFRRLVIGLSAVFIKVEIQQAERLPQPGGLEYRPKWYCRNGSAKIDEYAYVLAANHGMIWDISILGHFKRGMVWICKPAFCDNWLTAMINQRMGAVPIWRAGIDGRASKKNPPEKIARRKARAHTSEEGMAVALAALHRGIPVEMFPEGTRQGDAIVESSKKGAAWLAIKAEVPLVPFAIIGCSKGDPVVRQGLLRRRLVLGIVGEPIFPHEIHTSNPSDQRRTAVALTKSWERQINKLRAEGLVQLYYRKP